LSQNRRSLQEQLKNDALYVCLEYAARCNDQSLHPDTALAGMAGSTDGLSPADILDIARRSDLQCTLGKRDLADLTVPGCTAIVLLTGNRAGVISGDSQVLMLATEAGMQSHPLAEFADEYLGYALLVNSLQGSRRGDASTIVLDTAEQRAGWFWQTMWQFRSYYLQLLPASLLLNLFALAMPFFVMIVYDRVVPNQAVETLWVLAAGVLTVFLFDFVLRVVRGLVLERAGRAMDYELGTRLFEQVMATSLRAVPGSSGTLASRLRAYETLRDFFVSATMLAIADLPFSIVVFAVVFYLGGSVGWILVVAALTAIAVSVALQIPLYRAVNRAAESGLERNAFVAESVSQLETVKACNAEGALQRKMNAMLRFSSGHAVQSHWYALLGNSWTTAVMHFTSVAIVLASVYRIQDGAMTMGGMIAVVMLSSRCLAPLAMISGLMTRLQQALQSLRSLNGVMQLERETDVRQLTDAAAEPRARFEFRQLRFNYPGSDRASLKGIDLTINPGEKIALLGRIGSGKSTLLKIMAGLYNADDGKLLIDSIESTRFHPACIRRLVGYVPQDATLFAGSLRENLTIGLGQVDPSMLQQALSAAGLAEFVNQHPHGLDAEVGERGACLSGGQRRAAVLARCLLREPQMLLLDEPTANLDPATERQVISSLAAIARDSQRGIVLVTHKPALLEIVDRAIVVDGGQIVADGPVDQVVSKLRESRVVSKPQRVRRQAEPASV
jgi:ATP-binding cassette subfamily C protein LapB